MRRFILIASALALIILTLTRYPRSPHILPPARLDLPSLSAAIPKGDTLDPLTGALYFYHSHREGEQGHFHTFFSDKNAHHHLIGISLDATGKPTALFTTNDWVTGEQQLPSLQLIAHLDNYIFTSDDPTSQYLQALMQTLKPQILTLLTTRDKILSQRHLGRYEIVTYLPLE